MRKLGWIPDLPDLRDYTPEKLKLAVRPTAFPPRVDNREFCSPIEDQGALGSCTAHAAVGMYEYFQRLKHKKHEDLSRLFVYKTTRQLAGLVGDTGAYLRSTMGALRLFGAPPERYWPYNTADFEKEPTAFCYAYAQNFQAINYFRLDTVGLAPTDLLDRIKSYLFRNYSIMFGFSVYSSIWRADGSGFIPFPEPSERMEGGHAVLAVGYDDTYQALLIRNSWGTSWGTAGYGWLPYEYVLQGLADDFWSMTKAEWVETDQFAE